jgi:hypothetical protein
MIIATDSLGSYWSDDGKVWHGPMMRAEALRRQPYTYLRHCWREARVVGSSCSRPARSSTEARHMTKSQVKKLDTLIGKLEALQVEVRDRSLSDDLGVAKSALLRVLRSVGGI